MPFYEIATLSTAIFGAGKAAPGIEAWLAAGAGRLCGAWFSDIGRLNEIYLLRAFDTADQMLAERERLSRAPDPFGCAEVLKGYRVESYRPLDFMGPVEPGSPGPCYEIRTYALKNGGLMPTMEKWQAALPRRDTYSPCLIALYGIDGPPRLTQVWPYPSLEARGEARARSVAEGAWPPPGGPDWLEPDMVSTIVLPMPFSPLK